MLVSQTAQYALRAMTWIATLEPGDAIRAQDLAQATDVPLHYLSKILRRMVVDKLLSSRKGHGGGFSLARPASDIRFIEVLGAIDAAPSDGQCAFGWGACDSVDPCPMHDAWSTITEQVYTWASTTTLADVHAPSPEVIQRRGRRE